MKFLLDLFGSKKRIPKVDIKKRFDLIGRIGQGSMSRVWRARDSASGRMVALKVLDREKTKKLEERFVGRDKPTEGEIAMKLHHPNIVHTFEHGITTENEQFLVMEFIEGVGLSYLVDVQNERMKKNRLSYAIQLGEAIGYFHQENWIHRDLCPRNILVDNDDVVKLIDFGLAVPNTPAFQAPGNRTGTASYMAPELIKRQRTDQRIDIFSYGVTCFEMYTRRHPWKGSQSIEAILQHINQPPANIRSLAEDISPAVAEIIMRALESQPSDRWQKVSDMVYALREAQSALTP